MPDRELEVPSRRSDWGAGERACASGESRADRRARWARLVAAILAPASVLAVALTVGASAEQAPRIRAAIGPGCARARPAVAHYAGGAPLRRQPTGRPIPCISFVGQTVESAAIGVTRSGTVLYAPLDNNGAPAPKNVLEGPEFVARSRNLGATWSVLKSGGPTTGGLVPPWMSVDPVTSRIWFLTTLPGLEGARISWSDDGGAHWRTNSAAGCQGRGATMCLGEGSEKVLEGPAPRGGARPHAYPHVVYYCGNGGVDVQATLLQCYRSLNGGLTFTVIAHPDPAGTPGACGVNHAARPGTAGPDGTLYFPLDLCGDLGIAISHDEGASWQHQLVAHTEVGDLYTTSVATDSAGNVYIAWIAGKGRVGAGVSVTGLPYLTISRNHGRTWSKPIMIAAPGVEQARHTAITATGTGHIAVAYLGSTDGGANFSGYLTESRDSVSRRPVFWSAAVNDPARPLITGARPQVFGDRLFFISDAFGPDGTPWAAFHCAYESACPGRRIGVVGRLASP